MVDIYRVFTPKNKDDFYLLIYNISTIVIIILYKRIFFRLNKIKNAYIKKIV